ncbi:MAG: hypothetical protein JXM68_13525, partial [Sedimentisphaerales bacterium]|nr:hypothetical protein [Sedimentisphaerales bacterium]
MRWFMWLRFVIMFLLMSGPMAFAQIIEPDDLEGGVIASAGSSLGDADCEKQAFKRFSVDASTDLYFELVLDSCSVISYEVYSVLQGTSSDEIEPQELDVDDLICVWDEDATHGANLDTWTFTGAYEAVIIDDVDMCDYARVVTNDTSDTLNWKVYRVTVAGTFIVTGTGLNEHDVVKLEYNRIDLDNYDDVEDGYCVGLGDTVLYTVCLTNDTPECYEDVVARVYFDKGVTYAGADWQIDGQLNP